MSVSHDWSDPPDDCLVQGVGNEVLAVLLVIMGLVICLVFCLIQKKRLFVGRSQQVFGMREGFLSQDQIDAKIVASRMREDTTCAICIADPTSCTVVTNCNHSFCCQCMISHWTHAGSFIIPINCAVCRTQVTLLIPVDWPDQDEENEQILRHFKRTIGDYNSRFSEDRMFLAFLFDLPSIIPALIHHLLDYNGLLLMFRVRVVLIFAAIIAYVLMPLDIFPENAYGIIGFLDDIFVVVLMLIYMSIACRHFFLRRPDPHDN